jgi:hypothetical protein
MFTTKIRAAIAALAAAAAITGAGASVSPANAAVGSMSASLTVRPNYQIWSADSVGYVAMSQAEAEGLIAKNYRVVFRVWGDDLVSDDLLQGPNLCGNVYSSPRGLEFSCWGGRSSLDEDDSTFDDHDEIYAGIRLVTSASWVNGQLQYGTTVRSAETNRVGGYFYNRSR